MNTKSTRSGLVRIAGLAFAALALTGCVDDHEAAQITNVTTHHPISYGTAPESLFVEVAPHGLGLSQNQHADVYRFIDRYKAESTGSLRIEAPKTSRVTRSMRQVEELVQNAGIDPRAVQFVRQSGKSSHAAAVIMTYDRTVAAPPDCGDWSDDLGVNRERLPYNNFGCASQRNLALTVANGRDLQMPQQQAPRSSERRSTTWSNYINAGTREAKEATENTKAGATK